LRAYGRIERVDSVMMMFDSSAIYALIWLRKLKPLKNGYTIELARFELGNAIWKEAGLRKTIALDKAVSLINIVVEVLNKLRIVSIGGFESEILKLSYEENLTFYDAAYLYASLKLNIPLVTEDKKLYEKAKKYVTVRKVKEIL